MNILFIIFEFLRSFGQLLEFFQWHYAFDKATKILGFEITS